jgi:flagellar hook-length control protein FliK
MMLPQPTAQGMSSVQNGVLGKGQKGQCEFLAKLLAFMNPKGGKGKLLSQLTAKDIMSELNGSKTEDKGECTEVPDADLLLALQAMLKTPNAPNGLHKHSKRQSTGAKGQQLLEKAVMWAQTKGNLANELRSAVSTSQPRVGDSEGRMLANQIPAEQPTAEGSELAAALQAQETQADRRPVASWKKTPGHLELPEAQTQAKGQTAELELRMDGKKAGLTGNGGELGSGELQARGQAGAENNRSAAGQFEQVLSGLRNLSSHNGPQMAGAVESNPAAESTERPVGQSVQELFNRLVQHSQLQNGPENTTWRLTLHEPDLGQVKVHLNWDQDVLNASFTGRSEIGVDFEQQVIQPLRGMLDDQGIALGDLAWSGDGSDGWAQQDQNQGSQTADAQQGHALPTQDSPDLAVGDVDGGSSKRLNVLA